MAKTKYRVAILGGGPAGCALAFGLQQKGVIDILIVEPSFYDEDRIGESIPPGSTELFKKLGIYEDFMAERHETCLGSCSSWGSDSLGFNDFYVSTQGYGWHLDRRRFDLFLAKKAEERGATILKGWKFDDSLPKSNQEFLLKLKTQAGKTKMISADFVVDATGKQGRFANRQGAKRFFLDRLVSVAAYFDIPQGTHLSKLTLLEAAEYGWWYAARLPDRRLVVAVTSDPEIIKHARLKQEKYWLAFLKTTRHLSKNVAECRLVQGTLKTWVAPSFILDKAVGNGWLAIGDAASSYDPLSSQGIYKAMADGLEAAEAITSYFKGNIDPFKNYQASIKSRFQDYLQNRNYFYQQERRWPRSFFWNRRLERNELQKKGSNKKEEAK